MMGMGEPFHNYDEVLAACRAMNDADGFGLGARQIAISTAGWIPGIDRLAAEPLQVKLALSLHAPNDELRRTLMPVNRRYPLAELMDACRRYRERTRRRVFVEYLLLRDVNDRFAHADELADLLRPLGRGATHVNLIAYNPTAAGFEASDVGRVRAFRSALERRGVPSSYRVSRGREIAAACGQLAMQGIPESRRVGAAL
jgi:23S rRNA (adenine2503-C2)-methyltransferase